MHARVILHTVMRHSSISTCIPNFIEIEESLWTDGRADGYLRSTLLGRSTRRSRPKNLFWPTALQDRGFKSYSGQSCVNNLGQVVHTYVVPLFPSSITWYRPGKVMAAYGWVDTYSHLRADCLYTGISPTKA